MNGTNAVEGTPVPIPSPVHHKLPSFFPDGGYEWINYLTDRVREGRSNWQLTPMWGTQGWDLGNWPLVIVAIYPDESGKFFSVALYVEGDITVNTYPTRAELYERVNSIAGYYWRHFANGPSMTGLDENDMPEQYRGPYFYRRDTSMRRLFR